MSLRTTASLCFHLSRCLLVLLLVVSCSISLAEEPNAGQKLQKTSTNDFYKAFTINSVFSYYANNGDGSYNKYTTNAGFEFPRGSLKTAIFEDGVVWGGFHKGRTIPKVGGSVYRHALQAGRIITTGGATEAETPVADDPLKPIYRVFCARPDVSPATPFANVQTLLTDEAGLIARFETVTAQSLYDQYVNDWNEWPAKTATDPTGLAPFTDRNGDGLYDPAVDIPGEPGADQTLYYVANDMNATRTQNLAGCPPIGLEMHKTIWGYNRGGAVGQTIFSSTLLINKSGAPVDSMFFVQWSDPDLGDSGDDFVGCDTTRNLGFAYNGKPNDATYGIAVPAAGYRLLQGPRVPSRPIDSALFRQQYRHGFRNLPMTTFVFFTQGFPQYQDPAQGIDGDRQWYRLMNGLTAATGVPFVNPVTGTTTKFTLSGDPVTGQGWIDGMSGLTPQDRRMCMVSGPFTFAANDTQEIVVATLIAQGADRLSSVAQLKYAADLIAPVYPTGGTRFPPVAQVNVAYPHADSASLLITVDVRGTGAQPVSGLLKNVDGTVIPSIIFTDSGIAPDTVAGDRIFSAKVMTPRLPKALTLDLTVSDSTGSYTWPRIVQGITVVGPLSVTGPTIFSDNLNSNGEANPGENVRYGISILNTTSFPLSGLSVFQEGTLQKRIPWSNIATGASAGLTYDPANPASYLDADMPLASSGLSSYTVRYRITDANGNLWRDSVVFEVIPLPDSVRSNSTLHVAGIADGSFQISVVDQGALRYDLYVIHIADSINAQGDVGITLKDSTDGRILLLNHAFPDSLGHNMPVTDGFKVLRGTVDIQHKGYKGYSVPSGLRHWTWVDGDGWHMEGFYGAIGNAYDQWFSGSTVNHDRLKTIEIRYANADGTWDPKADQSMQPNFSRGYRYVRGASNAPAKPEFAAWITNTSAGYAYQDYNWSVPFSAWDMDVTPPVRLMVGNLENNGVKGLVDGRCWPPVNGAGLVNTTDTREFFFIFATPYSETPDPSLEVDILNNTVPMMWVGTVTRRSTTPNYADTSTFRILTYHTPTSGDMWIFRSDTTRVMGLGIAGSLPSVFALEQNYPNPFNPATTIRYALPQRSHVTLTVFNMLGQKVTELVNGEMDAGYHEVRFESSNLASGVYFYRLQAGTFMQTKKLLLLR